MSSRVPLRAVALGLAVMAGVESGTAQERPQPRDRFELSARVENHAALFRRALLPGPQGELVTTETAVPLQQFVFVQAQDIDAPWRSDSLDLELSAWTRVWLGSSSSEQRLDGDVQTALVRYRQGPLSLQAGRQHAAGGAARFVRFDGGSLSAALEGGLFVQAYGGLAVLPRWDAQPGYYQLGAADSRLRYPDALPAESRSAHWLAGGRVGVSSNRASAAASFHEQHETTGLSRRNLGIDAQGSPIADATIAGSTLLDLRAERVSELGVWADVTPLEKLDVTAEYLQTEPALFLSRQSVLSVFSTDAYREAGGTADYRWSKKLATQGGGWLQLYDEGHPGARADASVTVRPDYGRRTFARLGYSRLLAPDNGYHSLRASLSRRLYATLLGTLETYQYFYDEPIAGRRTSSVYATTLSLSPLEHWDVLWGASLAASPYARLDAETVLRVGYSFDRSSGGDQ